MQIDARCHCGFTSYEAEIDPEKVMICHCTDCQTLSGSAFRTVALTREGEFNLLSGNVKTYVKVAESGARWLQAFCPECGLPRYATSEADGPKVYSIRIGTSRQRDKLVPRAQIWCRSAQTWVGDLGTMQKVETQ